MNPNLTEDSPQIQLIKYANLMFESLNETENSMRLWKFFPTKAFRNLKKVQTVFVEYVLNCLSNCFNSANLFLEIHSLSMLRFN